MNTGDVKDGQVLWTPSARRVDKANLTHFLRWLRSRGRDFDLYSDLWQWSIDDQDGFWGSLWEYFDVHASIPYERVLGTRTMPGAEWFPGARLNYAEHALRHERDGADVLVYLSEGAPPRSISWSELGNSVRKLAVFLLSAGILPGDRVVAYLPNSPEAVIAMLATVSVGAVWASCGPDFGPSGVVDRFAQLEPKLVFCVDGYHYGGKLYDRRADLRVILESLPSLRRVVCLRRIYPDDESQLSDHTLWWEEAFTGPDVSREAFPFEQVPFAHPLWILFSSGTTGLPKPIIHSHGGMILEQMKALHFHLDVHPGERMFFYTTTGWMMWNLLVSALLVDVIPVLYDGNPTFPEPDVLWSMVERTGASFFGASPTYVAMLEKAGIVPKERFDLSRLESVLLAGSPVPAPCMAWFYRNVKQDMWVHSGSGGTDLCTGIVGGIVTQPIYAGEIQGRQLGVAAYAFNDLGDAVVDEVGEMVITRPLPSMPVGFWNDVGGTRYRDSYFDKYPGMWRHGDFFKVDARGGCLVLGRSDATLNRHGVRIGTAEIYRALNGLPEIEDALIVNLDLPGGGFFMPLFVKIPDGMKLDETLEGKIRARMRASYSARHLPDRIIQVETIPYTLTGKKMEVPVRRILMGVPVDKAANRSAMADSRSLDWFIAYAETQLNYRL